MLKDLLSAIRNGIYGFMRNRNIHKDDGRKLCYIAANNLYGYTLMQKLPYKDFTFTDITSDKVLDTDDDSDYGYWVI